MAYKGVEYLRKKLGLYRYPVLRKYAYYSQEDGHVMAEVAIPARISQRNKVQLGWCTRAVDHLADRLVVRGFENDAFGMWELFQRNNGSILFSSSIRGALVSACDFLYIYKDINGNVRINVIDGANATGILDRGTNLLTEGYAVLERDPDNSNVLRDAYFTPEYTEFFEQGKMPYKVPNPTGYCLLVPVLHRPDAVNEFGKSRISREMISIQNSAEDVLVRANVSAEFYSWPQKYVLGLDERADDLDTWKATISSMLRLDRDEDGNVPTLGQFAQQSMAPHIEHFKLMAQNFAGASGLTMDDLGFVSSNPSSAEAIKSQHEPLRVAAAEAQRNFEIAFINAGYIANCLQNNDVYDRIAMFNTKVIWAPVIEPDAAMLSLIGDGAIKINNAVPGYFDATSLENITGIKSAEA